MRKIAFVLALSACIGACGTGNERTSTETKEMEKNSWIDRTNVYEVNLRQYTPEGTINAFRKHLPRLKDMGVGTLWFMPITPIAQKNKKGTLGSYYAAADYASVSPEFGTVEDFKALVDEAHSMGMKVIIDWVANHTGWDHVWTKQHPEWYLKDSATNDFQIASGMDDIIELDFGNQEMRKAMIDAMKFWVVRTGIDGFRCDLAFWVELDFWQQAKHALDSVKPLFWLAELDPLEEPEYMQVFNAAYTWKWMHHAKNWYEKKQPVDSLVTMLDQYEKAPGIKTWFTTNHDENSWNGTEYEKYGDAAKPLAVFSATWKGIPLVYSGQEVPNKKRLEFFEKDAIKWTDKNELHDFYKKLFTLRGENPALSIAAEAIRVTTSDPLSILCYLRKQGENEVLVVLNLSPSAKRFEISDSRVTGKFSNRFSGAENDFSTEKSFEMQGWEYLVYSK
jgi:alpha-amylase